MDTILAQHKLWLDSGEKSGRQADLARSDLKRAELAGANLSHADLSGADLTSADMARAELRYVQLAGAQLEGASLDGADLFCAQLPLAQLTNTNLQGANLSNAKLTGAQLSYAHLAHAQLIRADLDRAWLYAADLTQADLRDARLTNAQLDSTDMGGADMEHSDLNYASFEPKNLPVLELVALARGLERMTYLENPGPLTRLRRQFQEGGYRAAERAITCALNRVEAERGSLIEGQFKRIAFDLTCEYGFSPGRPLRIVLWLWLLFACVYVLLMHQSGPSGIYVIGNRTWRGRSNTQGIQIRPRNYRVTMWRKLSLPSPQSEWRVLRTAMFFSLMSAFNIGFRDINFGRWLRMLTKREYDLKAVGWARTVSGAQSLLSVYLIALWVLTYFGRPFG